MMDETLSWMLKHRKKKTEDVVEKKEKPSKVWTVKASDYMPKPPEPTLEEEIREHIYNLDKKHREIETSTQEAVETYGRMEALYEYLQKIMPAVKVEMEKEKVKQKLIREIKSLEQKAKKKQRKRKILGEKQQ